MTCLEDCGCLITWNASSSSLSDVVLRVRHSNSLEIGDSTVGVASSEAFLGDGALNLSSELAYVGSSLLLCLLESCPC